MLTFHDAEKLVHVLGVIWMIVACLLIQNTTKKETQCSVLSSVLFQLQWLPIKFQIDYKAHDIQSSVWFYLILRIS